MLLLCTRAPQFLPWLTGPLLANEAGLRKIVADERGQIPLRRSLRRGRAEAILWAGQRASIVSIRAPLPLGRAPLPLGRAPLSAASRWWRRGACAPAGELAALQFDKDRKRFMKLCDAEGNATEGKCSPAPTCPRLVSKLLC